jgi:hypothetical protein
MNLEYASLATQSRSEWRGRKQNVLLVCECGEHSFVGLGRGRVAFADADVADQVPTLHWGTNGTTHKYVSAGVAGRRVTMHRLIMGATCGKTVDHIDGNPMNNRRANLRLATHAENMKNRKRKNTASSKFKGIETLKTRWYGRFRYRARIRNDGKIHLGSMRKTEAEAAADYDRLAIQLHGEFARTNAALGLLK